MNNPAHMIKTISASLVIATVLVAAPNLSGREAGRNTFPVPMPDNVRSCGVAPVIPHKAQASIDTRPAAGNTLTAAELNRIADVIWRIEGGANTRHPYGVLSVATSNPRQVCINSIRNNYARWQRADKPGQFSRFMANRWCPVAADPVGNRNWINNFNKLAGEIK